MRKFFIFIITAMILSTINCFDDMKILFDRPSSRISPKPLLFISFYYSFYQDFPSPPNPPFTPSISFSELYVVDTDGNNLIQLTNDKVNHRAPNWSPDGNKIVFYSDCCGAMSFEIFIMDLANGKTLTKLTDNSFIDYLPVWSPDGNKILFVSDRDGVFDKNIYVMDNDGLNQTQLTTYPGWDDFPRWSKDGSKIVFMSNRDGNNEIYVMDNDGLNQKKITNTDYTDPGNNATPPVDNSTPDWSPDGNKIIFVSNSDDGHENIYIMDKDGTNQEKLTDNTGAIHFKSPSCSPDGRITFSSDLDGNFDIYVMDIDGSNVRQLTYLPIIPDVSLKNLVPLWVPSSVTSIP